MGEEAERAGRTLVERIIEGRALGHRIDVVLPGVSEPVSVREASHHNGVAKLVGDYRTYHVALGALAMVMETEPLDPDVPGDFQGLPAGGLNLAP